MKKRKKILPILPIVLSIFLTGCTLLGSSKTSGPKGDQGIPGENGKDGKDGVSVVSIEKTSSNGNVDTYTITYSDGSTSTFTVTNGENGEQGIQGYPGADGHTPVITIGGNGNWYVDGVDTGIKAQGPQGPAGQDGKDGQDGTDGVDGIDGTSVLTGNGSPSMSLGKDGDSYINLLTWDYYVKENGYWVLKGNIKGADGQNGTNGTNGQDGAQGPQGEQGPQGPQGPAGQDGTNGTNGTDGIDGQDGTSMLTGNGVPASSLGKDGDSYIDLSTWNFYVKEDGSWVQHGNIKGADGANGTNGTNGTNGQDGQTGPQGPQGEQGPQGPAGQDGTNGTNGQDGQTAWSNTILPSEHGYVLPSVGSAIVGASISFTCYPDSGYELRNLYVNNVDVTSSVNGSLTYTTTMVEGGFVVRAVFDVQLLYTVTWKDYDGTVLEVDNNLNYGDMPSYDGKTPTRPNEGNNIYTFSGWYPAVTSVTGNAIYTAQYDVTTLSYKVIMDESNYPYELSSNYQNNFTDTVVNESGDDVEMTFVNARTLTNGFVELAPRGKIYNFGTTNDAIVGIESVKFTGTGTLKFKPVVTKDTNSVNGAIIADVDPITIVADGPLTTVPTCDYFELTAADGGAQIESLEINYSNDDNATEVKLVDGTYTGIGVDSYVYKLEINNGAGYVEVLDAPYNLSMSGTVAMTSKTSITCSFEFNSYPAVYNFSYNGHSLTFVSKSGAGADYLGEISFDRVYNVEDFESYSATGQGYTNSTTKYQTSGLRAEYYADYYTGSGSGEIGGTGWPVMTSTDNTNFNNSKGHNDSKVGIFKGSNGMGMRYISMNSLYGVESRVGKGSVLSFWARGAYTNTNFNTNHPSNTPIKMFAYYDTPLNAGNQVAFRESFDFTVIAGSTWQHFEMPLTAGRNYYGFGFYINQSSGTTQYIPIDDLQIYTASPYAEYVAPVAVTGVSVSPNSAEVIINKTTQLTATVSPADADNKNVTWTSSNTSVATVSSTGLVTGVATGSATITATTVDGGYFASSTITVVAPAVNYPEGTFKGAATVSSADYAIVISIGTQSSGLVAVRLSNKDAVATGITYNSSTNAFSITTTGDYSGYSFGTISGTYDISNDRLVNVSCSGDISAGVSNNGSITCTRPSASEAFYDCDGTTSELQATFKRRYMSGSWQVDNSNMDRITSNTTEFVCGTGAVKRRGYSGGAVALTFQNDFSPAKTVANVQFWVYNPSGSDITLRMWCYRGTSFGNNYETGSVTAKAGQWTYVAMGFTSAAIYNFQIADFNNTGVYLTFDNIYLF